MHKYFIFLVLLVYPFAYGQMLQSISNTQKVPDTGITFTPAAGAVSNPTTVTFSGAFVGSIYCSTQNGTTPATNGLGTACTTGSLGNTTSITSAVTVKVVSGLLGDADSAVSSAAYTISGGGGHTFAAPATANNRCYASAASGTSLGCTLGTAPASGSFVTVHVFGGFSMSSMTMTDGSHSYTATSNSPSNTNDATAGSDWLFYWSATATGGATVTASWAGTCSFCSIRVDNFGITGAGAVVPDVVPTCAGAACSGSGTTVNNPTITSPTNGDLLICAESPENTTSSTNSPWTQEAHGLGAFDEVLGYILSSSGTQACAFSISSGHWDSIGASFK